MHHLASFCQSNRGAYTFNAVSESEGSRFASPSEAFVRVTGDRADARGPSLS